MRSLYENRQQILLAEIEKRLAGFLEIKKASAGMHLVGWLPESVSDYEISEKAAANKLNIAAVSSFYAEKKPPRGGLLLGYTAFDETQIKEGVERLASILQ